MFFGISCRHTCPELTSTAAGDPGHHPMQGARAELYLGQGRCPRLAEPPNHSTVGVRECTGEGKAKGASCQARGDRECVG